MNENENNPNMNMRGSKMAALNLMTTNEKQRVNAALSAYRNFRNSPNNTTKRNNAKRMYKNLNPTNKGYFRLMLNENEKNMVNQLNKNNNGTASDPGSPRSLTSSVSEVNSPSVFFKNMPRGSTNVNKTFRSPPVVNSRSLFPNTGNQPTNALNVFSQPPKTPSNKELAENLFSRPAVRGGKRKSRKASRRRLTRRRT